MVSSENKPLARVKTDELTLPCLFGLLLDSRFVQDSYCEAFCIKLAPSFDTEFVGMVHTVRTLGVFLFFFFFVIDIKINKVCFCLNVWFVRKVSMWKSSQIIWNPVKSEPYDLSNEIDMRKNYFNYRQQYYSSRVWENIMV